MERYLSFLLYIQVLYMLDRQEIHLGNYQLQIYIIPPCNPHTIIAPLHSDREYLYYRDVRG